MSKFKNKYRIESARLAGWNYANEGLYFVTICTHKRVHYFRDIAGGVMNHSIISKFLSEEILKTPGIRPYVILDEWIVMPNHVHLILAIDHGSKCDRVNADVPRECLIGKSGGATFGPQRHTLGSIIRGIKSAVIQRVRILGDKKFRWQERFHDHIIRDDNSLQRIRYYVRNNISTWEEDCFYRED